MGYRSYEGYGIDPVWVKRLKKKAKEPRRKERLKELAEGLTREDLQNRELVNDLVSRASRVLGEKLTTAQREQLVGFVLDQQIDPDNMLHLLRLWNMFR